jgi:fumarate hydratase class II
LNAPEGFGEKAAAEIAGMTGHPFVRARNLFAAQGSLDGLVAASAALRSLAVALMKIANDLRWLGSGPRAGLHELNLPENEPGSSIMPGKVNPTQQEAMVMVCIEVIGEDNAVAFAGSQGNFELNAMRPIIIRNVLHCARILADACLRFREFGVEGITLDRERMQKYVDESLMTVTSLSPVIGYDKAAKIAHRAVEEDITVREAAMKGGWISGEEFDRVVDTAKMVGNPRTDLGC